MEKDKNHLEWYYGLAAVVVFLGALSIGYESLSQLEDINGWLALIFAVSCIALMSRLMPANKK